MANQVCPSHRAALPGTSEAPDHFGFAVEHKGKQKGICWAWKERVAPKQPKVPRADVLAVRVANQDEKAALLAGDPEKFFTEPHYNGFPAVLVRLPRVTVAELRKLIGDAWQCQAPKPKVPAAPPTRSRRTQPLPRKRAAQRARRAAST